MWLSSYLWSRTFRWRLHSFVGAKRARGGDLGNDSGLSRDDCGEGEAGLPGVGRTMLTALLRQRVRDGFSVIEHNDDEGVFCVRQVRVMHSPHSKQLATFDPSSIWDA